MVSTEIVKQLREETGVSVIQCKKALEEADGDLGKAREILQQKGAEVAAKKADRELGSGVVASYVHTDNRLGVLVELLSETDFVARNEEFKGLAEDIAMHIAAVAPRYVRKEEAEAQESGGYSDEEILLDQPFIKNPEVTIANLIEQATQKFGEKITVSRFARYALLEE